MRNVRYRWLLVILLAPFLTASVCGGGSESILDPSADEFDKTVDLFNDDGLESSCVHVFAPGETFPCCQVCTSSQGMAGQRTVVMHLVRQQRYEFRAGRNGEILATKSCKASGAESERFRVDWNGSGLRCRDGFVD
jgi:hypothetical protein